MARRKFLLGVSVALLAAHGAFTAAAETVELGSGNMLLSAPSEVDCDAPPDFTLTGAGPNLFAADREALNALVAQMAGALAGSCDDLDRITVLGEERGISFSFDISREDGWRLDPADAPQTPATIALPDAPDASPEPVETAAAAQPQTAAETGAPPAETPQEPTVAPGLDFQSFAAIFGTMPSVRGHVAFDNNEIWNRVLAARTYAVSPGILSNDMHAIEVLAQMATQPEYAQVMGPWANRRPQDISVFERRDIAERIRTQIAPGLNQRRQTGPIKVYHSVRLRLGEYDFNSQSFPLQGIENARNHRSLAWMNAQVSNVFANVALPARLGATQDQARQLDAYLRSRNDPNLWFAIFAEIDPEMPRSLSQYNNGQQLASNTKVVQIALFADQGLNQVVFDFTAELAPLQAAADVAASALSRRLTSGEDMVRAIDALNGGAAATTAIAEVYANSSYYNQGNETPQTRREAALSSLQAASPSTLMHLTGNLRLGSYDPVRKVMPVTSFSARNTQFNTLQTNAGFQQTFAPNLTEIPMSPDVAAEVQRGLQSGQMEFRMTAELVQGSHRTEANEIIYFNTILRPVGVQLFVGGENQNRGLRRLVLDAELPLTQSAVPSLLAPLQAAE